jgi:hypothetical protein
VLVADDAITWEGAVIVGTRIWPRPDDVASSAVRTNPERLIGNRLATDFGPRPTSSVELLGAGATITHTCLRDQWVPNGTAVLTLAPGWPCRMVAGAMVVGGEEIRSPVDITYEEPDKCEYWCWVPGSVAWN